MKVAVGFNPRIGMVECLRREAMLDCLDGTTTVATRLNPQSLQPKSSLLPVALCVHDCQSPSNDAKTATTL
jgi:hypothetical protein